MFSLRSQSRSVLRRTGRSLAPRPWRCRCYRASSKSTARRPRASRRLYCDQHGSTYHSPSAHRSRRPWFRRPSGRSARPRPMCCSYMEPSADRWPSIYVSSPNLGERASSGARRARRQTWGTRRSFCPLVVVVVLERRGPGAGRRRPLCSNLPCCSRRRVPGSVAKYYLARSPSK